MGLYQVSGRGRLWGGVCTPTGPGEHMLNWYRTWLFFINELLEVPGELLSLRGWAGLPQAPSWTKGGTAQAAHGVFQAPLCLFPPGHGVGDPQHTPWQCSLPGTGPTVIL